VARLKYCRLYTNRSDCNCDEGKSIDTLQLKGFSILVTRPEQQADSLCKGITAAGGQVVSFPVIEIEPLPVEAEAAGKLQHAGTVDMVIFISANAVRYGLPVMQQIKSAMVDMQVVAIGKATASALDDAGMVVDVLPEAPYNSEALLALAELHDVAGKHILIVRGKGGRELLGEQLTKRGAQVSYLEVYKRAIPDRNMDDVIDKWRRGEINAVTTTSIEGIDNLVQMLGEAGLFLLKQTPQVVISKRMYDYMQKLAISAPVAIADEASDNAIIEALIKVLGDQEPEVEHE